MSAVSDCAICAGGAPIEIVAELDASIVAMPAGKDRPRPVWVIARTHVVEPFDLPELQRRRYWNELTHTARALRDVTGAARVTYEIDGDAAAHLRTELYPRGATRDATSEQLTAAIAAEPPTRPPSTADVLATYDEMSRSFEQQLTNGFYNVHYDRPAVLGLCGEVSGLRVAELGCGPGFYLAELRARGADVLGVDGSAALLDLARARLGPNAELHHHDLEQPLSMLDDESLDAVLMALVYHHIDDRPGLLSEILRVLRPGGWLVLSTSHPTEDWLAAGGSYFTVERTDAVFALAGSDAWRVPFWRLPMGVLLDEILGAGFVLDRLVEPVPPADRAALDPRLHRRLMHEPAFLALRAHRPA